jgi:hemolysin D
MPRFAISSLTDCSEFSQTVAAKPPRIVHGAAILLSCIILSALGWAATTRANLVVLAQGRVRPEQIPTRVFTPSGPSYDGHVVEAPFDEGATVRQGDLLVRLDTTRIDNLIAKVTHTIEAGKQELANLIPQRDLLALHCQSSEAKARTELRQAEVTVRLAKEKRESDVRQARAEWENSEAHYERIRKLAVTGAASQQQLADATAKRSQAQEQLVKAELPIDEGAVDVARQALDLVARDFAVRTADLETRIAAKQGEVDVARRDLAGLVSERQTCELRSPIDGVVAAGRIRVGDILESGKPALELAPRSKFCFEAVVPGSDVGQLKVGMPVKIRFDAYDYQRYGALEGTVAYLSPDSRELNPEQMDEQLKAAGNRPVAFIVRIEMNGDEVGRGDLRGSVRLGLNGTAEIITQTESLLNILFIRIRKTISLT